MLLHTNDMHNRRGAFPYLASFPRTSRTMLVDAGDAIRGSNTVFHFREPMLDRMSALGYDAMAFGNREFHYLRGVLFRRYRQVSFPFLCANLCDMRRKASQFWRPYLLKQVDGVRVGLIGLTPVQYNDSSLWQPITGFRFLPPMEVLPDIVATLRSQVDVLILLSHSGFEADREIARGVDGIDCIVGGHSHTVLEAPTFVGGTAIVQAGSHGRFVGKMQMRLRPGGGIEVIDYALVPMQSRDGVVHVREAGGAA